MLSAVDPEAYKLCQKERKRQQTCLELIASENFASEAVLQALSSSFHNKYSEGQVGARYYGGNEHVDSMESLCIQRALDLFSLSTEDWGVNVQPYSGSPANFAVFTGLVGPHGRIMGLHLPDGGHLTHGYYTPTGKNVSASSIFFESMPYFVDKVTGLIDYDDLEKTAKIFRPKMIIAGTSAYSRQLDYARFKKIADSVGALLMADMAHISGLIATGLHPSPFDYADVVTTTTHKTLRCARGAMIFCRKRKLAPASTKGMNENGSGDAAIYVPTDYQQRVNEAVFPALQGGPHDNNIVAIAVGLLEASKPEYKEYIRRVVENAKRLASRLHDVYGYEIVTGGTDTHVFLVDFRPVKMDGSRIDFILGKLGITVNKNTVPGDKSALRPSGIRLGTPALTTRGFGLEDMDRVADYIHAGVQLALEIAKSASTATLKDFKIAFMGNADAQAEINRLNTEITAFASGFPLPGMPDF